MMKLAKTRGRRSGQNRDLTTADLVVLSLLVERSMHGYDLLAEYRRQEVADWASVSKAQLYYALGKLSGLALIAGKGETGISRERTVFSTTTAGRQALSEALSDPAWASARIAQPFATWIGLSLHAAPGAERKVLQARLVFIDAEAARERNSLAYIETLSGERARRGGHIVRLVLRQLDVEREWIVALLAEPN